MRRNALTVDVEEWHQTVLFGSRMAEPGIRTDLPQNVSEILSLLAAFGTQATFFVVASVAEKYPGLIESIASRGHEIASHGYCHRLVYSMSEGEFASDAMRSRAVLGRLAGSEIAGYRASTWSIFDDSGWAVRALDKAGFKYDSSIYPVKFYPQFGRDWEKRRFPRRLECGLWEFPPSTFRFLGWNLPFAGGTFMRCLSPDFLKKRIMRINSRGMPAMVYFHSWEFSKAPPAGLPAWKRLVQYGNATSVKNKIEELLRSFEFRPIRDLLPDPHGSMRVAAGNENSISESSA